MPITKERQYRNIQAFQTNQNSKRIDSNYYTEGYATTWERYLLWEDDEGPIYEQIRKDAFINCDMSDVIMQYDHSGKVLARVSNKTLLLETDDHGLFICGDLSKSKAAMELYEEISNELITKMSWSFLPGSYHFDKASRTLIHDRIKKMFDVSAVSIPANDTTDIYARSFVNGEIGKVKRELLEHEKRKLFLKLKLEGVM